MERVVERAAVAPAVAVPPAVLLAVASAGADDAGGLDTALLGDFLEVVTEAVVVGRRLSAAELQRYRGLGSEAARRGVALRALLDLYLSSAWRLWRHLPAVAGAARDPAAVVTAAEAVLRAADDGVAALAEGFQLARRDLVREQEAARREFVDDLLVAGGDVAGLLRRAVGFGLDLSGPHAVAVVEAQRPFADGTPLLGALERALQGRKADADALVASKEGLLVVVLAAPDRAAVSEVTDALARVLGPTPGGPARVELLRRSEAGAWRMGVGRRRSGPAGVRTSYEEARDALLIGSRLDLADAIVDATDLLVHQVVLRDRPAITDLIEALLLPLEQARGGAEPLLATLRAWFASGGNSAAAARALHLSVRAVTYRLQRVHALTGQDPAHPDQRLALEVAVLGARLLDWPARPLP